MSSTAADRGVHSWYADAGISHIKQDFVSGAKAERTLAGAEARYFYNRTYGAEVVYRKNLDYTYTTAGGLKRDTVSDANVTFALLFYPAMNFNFRLVYDPKSDTNIVFEDERQLRVSGGHSYTLALEFNF